MSDYRRWISYIYAYENGVKKRNAGYAKLELKDGKLTMTLHVTPDNRAGDYRVCLYKSQAGHREGVLLGRMEKGQGGEGTRFVEDASDLRGSGLLFQEMNGLLLYDDRGKYLISSWEDEPVEIPVMQAIAALLEKGQGDKVTGENGKDKMSLEEGTKHGGGAEKWKAKSNQEEDADGMDGREKQSSNPDPEEKANTVDTQQKEKDQPGFDPNRNPDPKQQQETPAPAPKPAPALHTESAEESHIPKTTGNVPKESRISALESRVFSCLPAMYPFEHQEFERSVRMEPQDLGLLPREMWKYAGNSFLLHSYYAYHHMLFVRKMRGKERNCYLMLPGVYDPKEQHMAQLFGFSKFCPVRKKPLQQGDFGYWYMEVGFPETKSGE